MPPDPHDCAICGDYTKDERAIVTYKEHFICQSCDSYYDDDEKDWSLRDETQKPGGEGAGVCKIS